MHLSHFLKVSLLLFLFASCKQNPTTTADQPVYPIQKKQTAPNGMVVSAHPLASEIGKSILEKGGTATDAAVAVQLALAVVYPAAGNLGGGGFMIRRGNDGTVTALDYREKAPLSATRDMYLDDQGEATDKSRFGHLSAGVPGTVDGLFEAHKKFGKLPFKTLIQPAIDLANKGFQLTENEANRYSNHNENISKYSTGPNPFTKKATWLKGDQIKLPELGQTLIQIRDKGRAGFYEGTVADFIVEEMKKGNGIISLEDLKQYQSVWRDPIKTNFKEYTIYSMPPPSSGGLVLAQLLEMVEPYELKLMGFQSISATHLMVEAERRAYADRAKYMGDSDFYAVPVKGLSDSAYAVTKMESFDAFKASTSKEIGAGKVPLESEETTHLSIVDKEGNAVSITTTLNSSFGSKVYVQGAGFFLNNEMDDFSAKPGVPNLYGLVGGEANAIAPKKRMLSSMTPTIVEKENDLFLVVGTPGGSTIITSVFQVFINIAVFDMDLETAVQSPRFHHQWLPDKISIEEEALSIETRNQLKSMGHTIEERESIGRVDAILVLPDGQLTGVGDRRGDDSASGY